MRRGTTPTIAIRCPDADFKTFKDITVTVRQDGQVFSSEPIQDTVEEILDETVMK